MFSICNQTCIKNTIYTRMYVPSATAQSTASARYTYKLSLCDQTCIKIIRYTWDHRLDAIVLSLAHTKNNIIMINVKAV